MTDSSEPIARARRAIIDSRMIWRWHFYAGLFCIPFILILCITGPIYLFKPQIEAAIDSPYDHLTFTGPPQPVAEAIEAAVTAVPGAHFSAMEIRPNDHDAIRVVVERHGVKTRLYVHPQNLSILKQVAEKSRFMEVVKCIHGELFSGTVGRVIVEGAACWAIVMVLTGLYLWWPRNASGPAGVFYPRFDQGRRIFWRDLHSVTGMYVSIFALFLMITGLPWTYVWGNGLKALRSIGKPPVTQEWSTGGHDHNMMPGMDMAMTPTLLPSDALVSFSRRQFLAPPVMLSPADTQWALKSESGNRTAQITLRIDPASLKIVKRSEFRDKKLVDRIVWTGVSAHEGQLFGPLNQVLGLLTAVGLLTLCGSAVVMWWRRRPRGSLGAPLKLPDERLRPGLVVLICAMGVLLPVLGISLLTVGLLEWLVLRRVPAVRDWLGLET